jgi:hypothetical protein
MSVEIILGQIAESLRDLVHETRENGGGYGIDLGGVTQQLEELGSSVDTVAEKLESIDTHLVELCNAVP